jgi:hypothetical protein
MYYLLHATLSLLLLAVACDGGSVTATTSAAAAASTSTVTLYCWGRSRNHCSVLSNESAKLLSNWCLNITITLTLLIAHHIWSR